MHDIDGYTICAKTCVKIKVKTIQCEFGNPEIKNMSIHRDFRMVTDSQCRWIPFETERWNRTGSANSPQRAKFQSP